VSGARLERYFKTSDVADMFSVHPETVRRAAASGDLRSIRLGGGGERRYAETAIRDWVALMETRAVERSKK